jgi:hypothetical protein
MPSMTHDVCIYGLFYWITKWLKFLIIQGTILVNLFVVSSPGHGCKSWERHVQPHWTTRKYLWFYSPLWIVQCYKMLNKTHLNKRYVDIWKYFMLYNSSVVMSTIFPPWHFEFSIEINWRKWDLFWSDTFIQTLTFESSNNVWVM